MEEEKLKGTVFNIQHYCYQDGPGVRTTVFLKGCSLQCKWCGNPEGIHKHVQLTFDPKECVGVKACGLCLKNERAKDVLEVKDDRIHVLWDQVREEDYRLAEDCPLKALSTYGKIMTPREVIDEVNKDCAFYRGNRGGITLSGGEPLLQPEFARKVLELAHECGYTTAIETAGNVPWESMEEVLPHIDTVIHDIKVIDDEKHRKWIGISNRRLLDNFRKAYEAFPEKKFIARTPLIPGVNDTVEDIREILAYLSPYGNVVKYELMPYHKLGLMKYESLGLDYPMGEEKSLEQSKIQEFREMIQNFFQKRGVV